MKKRKDYRKSKTLDNLLTAKEIEKLKASATSNREKMVVNVLLYTGMRVGEFIHMTKGWLDFKREIIRVPLEAFCDCPLCLRSSGVWRPKTPQGSRTIPMIPEIVPLLKGFFKTFKSIREMIPSTGSAYYHLKKVANRAGIKHPVFPHALRGTFASTLAEKDFQLFEITQLMGWKSIKPAEKYIRLSGEHLTKVFKEKW